jgi:hypothetical protein
MHQLCYFNTSNIEITETPATHPQEEQLAAVALTVPTMRHADLDEFFKKFCNIWERGRRKLLVHRKQQATNTIKRQIENVRRNQINQAKRAAFIGPLTIQMRNGHPF